MCIHNWCFGRCTHAGDYKITNTLTPVHRRKETSAHKNKKLSQLTRPTTTKDSASFCQLKMRSTTVIAAGIMVAMLVGYSEAGRVSVEAMF